MASNKKITLNDLLNMSEKELLNIYRKLKEQATPEIVDNIQKRLHSSILNYLVKNNMNMMVSTFVAKYTNPDIPKMICIDNEETDVSTEYGVIVSQLIENQKLRDGLTIENSFDSIVSDNTKYHIKNNIEIIYKVDNNTFIIKATYNIKQL